MTILARLLLILGLAILPTACGNRSDGGTDAKSGTMDGTVKNVPIAVGAAPEVLVYRDVPPETAAALNAKMPISTEPLVPARPFKGPAEDTDSAAAASDCMTAALYYEAASEPDGGMSAVAQVVLNRVRHPAYPKSVCGVVFQGSERATGCQFTFTCDGSLARLPSSAGWARARRLADRALSGYVEKSAGLSTHYHTQWVVPYWRSDLTKTAVIGAHIFYKWSGGWGGASAFRSTYADAETLPLQLAVRMPSALLRTRVPTETGADVALVAVSQPDLKSGDRRFIPGADAQAHVLVADSAVRTEPTARKTLLVADETRGRLAIDDHGSVHTDN